MISFNTETLQNVFVAFLVPVLPGEDEWAFHMLGDLIDVTDLIRAAARVHYDAHTWLETKGKKK